jgi:hypothetical protein
MKATPINKSLQITEPLHRCVKLIMNSINFTKYFDLIQLLFIDPYRFIKKVKIKLGIATFDIKKIIKHNKKVWSDYKNSNSESIILFDYYPLAETELARSYLLNILAKKFNAKIVSYSVNRNIRSRIWDRIYYSYNVESHLSLNLSRLQKKESRLIYEKITPTIQTKQDLFDLHINDVWIGVDVYEEYLMRYKKPTVDMTDVRVRGILQEGIDILVFFIDYFNQHDVKAIDSSHIGVRLKSNLVPKIAGQLFNIPYYSAHARSVIYYPEPHLYHEAIKNEYMSYPSLFKSLDKKSQKEGLSWAKKRLDLRMSGNIGVDMSYSTKSAFTEIDYENTIVKDPSEINVLICTHEFYDSPNCYGGLLFTDFYEWLIYLSKLSKKTNYNWYVKTHPDAHHSSVDIIKSIVSENENFCLVPKNTSFKQLAYEGMDFALTCYGTIGHELPLLGIQVINAGVSPRVAYDFNYHPKSLDEYKGLLMNLPIEKKLNIKKLYEFYFIQHKYVHSTDDFIFDSYEKSLSELSDSQRIGFEVFTYFLKSLTKKKHNNIISKIEKFIDSGKIGVATKNDF